MLVRHKDNKLIIHTWDYKDIPSFNSIYKAVKMCFDTPKFTEADTKSDQFCVVVSEEPLTSQEATKIYNDYYHKDDEKDWIEI